MQTREVHLHIIFWQNAPCSAPSYPAASAVLAGCLGGLRSPSARHWSLTITATSLLWSLKSPIIRNTPGWKKSQKKAEWWKQRFRKVLCAKCFTHDATPIIEEAGGWGENDERPWEWLKSTQSECSGKGRASPISHCHIRLSPQHVVHVVIDNLCKWVSVICHTVTNLVKASLLWPYTQSVSNTFKLYTHIMERVPCMTLAHCVFCQSRGTRQVAVSVNRYGDTSLHFNKSVPSPELITDKNAKYKFDKAVCCRDYQHTTIVLAST